MLYLAARVLRLALFAPHHLFIHLRSSLQATVHLASLSKDKSSVLKVKNVNVKVDSIKFSIRDCEHDLLYKILRPLATGFIKKQITTAFECLDGELVFVRDRYDEAKRLDVASRADALKTTLQRNKQEAGPKKGEGASTASKRNSQFKVVAKRDSAIVQAGHDAGYSTKVQERADAAKKGENWHSDAFTIL